jgi:hypothetical protein
MRFAVGVFALLAVSGLAGCAGGGRETPTRVAVIVLENRELSAVIGSPEAPYLNRLAGRYALATNGHGLRHPSLPNYVALVAGTTAGIASDCLPSECPVSSASLVDQLSARRLSWRAYMESMPRPCFRYAGEEYGAYAQRHNPFAYLSRVAGDPRRCAQVVGFDRLRADLRRGLPRFSWITPNLCHDMHDCSVSEGDRWLRRIVPPLLRGLGRRGLLVVTFDEGTTGAGCCGEARGGRIATLLAGPLARRRARSDAPVDHYSTLATVEDLLGLPRLGRAAAVRPLAALLEPNATAR